MPLAGRDGRRRRVQRADVAGVVDAKAGVEDPPGEIDALVHEPELAGPAANQVEDGPAHRDRPLPQHCHVARPRAIADAQARHPVARVRAAAARRHAELQRAERRVCVEPCRDPRQGVVAAKARVVVEEEQEFAARLIGAGIARGGDAEVLGEPERARPRRQRQRLRAVEHDHHVELDAALRAQRVECEREHVGTAAGREDDAAERHLRRLDVRIASRCPTTVIAATGMRTITSAFVPPTIAAMSARPVNSIATNAR